MGMREIMTGVWAWMAAAAATYFLTNVSLLFPLRVRISERFRLSADRQAAAIKAMAPDDPRRRAARTRYWFTRAATDFPFCKLCVGMWAYLMAMPAAWLALGAPAEVWGASAWISVPAATIGGWMLFLAFANLLPDVGYLRDHHGVEDSPQ